MKTIFWIKLPNLLASAILVVLILLGVGGSYTFLAQADAQSCVGNFIGEGAAACSMEAADCTENCEDPDPTPPPPGTNCSEHCVDVGWDETLSVAVF